MKNLITANGMSYIYWDGKMTSDKTLEHQHEDNVTKQWLQNTTYVGNIIYGVPFYKFYPQYKLANGELIKITKVNFPRFLSDTQPGIMLAYEQDNVENIQYLNEIEMYKNHLCYVSFSEEDLLFAQRTLHLKGALSFGNLIERNSIMIADDGKRNIFEVATTPIMLSENWYDNDWTGRNRIIPTESDLIIGNEYFLKHYNSFVGPFEYRDIRGRIGLFVAKNKEVYETDKSFLMQFEKEYNDCEKEYVYFDESIYVKTDKKLDVVDSEVETCFDNDIEIKNEVSNNEDFSVIKPNKPYKGNEPYIFISYPHCDKDEVFGVISHMQNKGYRVWYDEGIDPGTEWLEYIAKHIDKAEYVFAFISDNYLQSCNCKDELNYARVLNKKRLIIYLEDVDLSPGNGNDAI